MITFNGNEDLKKELIEKLRHHQDLDTFVQGTWLDTDSEKVEGNGFKGCFYGCTMQTKENPIEKFSKKYNIDLWYCHLTEKIFESLPKGKYEKFPLQSIKALPVGFDINKIKSLFHYKILENQLQYCVGDIKVTKAIKQCMALFKTPFNKIEESAARSAAESAESAAESAAWSAARSAAESAAWSAESAAESARSAAESAAWSAESAAWSAESAAESASKENHYIFLRDVLFECIKNTTK